MEDRLNNEEGTISVGLFFSTKKSFNPFYWPRLFEKVPWNLFPLKYSHRREDGFPMDVGISLVKLLETRSSSSSLDTRAKPVGIWPVRLLL